MSAIETFKVQNLTVRIEQDQDRQDGSRDWDNLGTMVCFHRNYRLGDKHEYKTPQDFMATDDYKNAVVILPLGLIDHSGISMYVGSGAHWCDPGGWDSGQVGWIYVTKEKARSEYGKRLTKKRLAQAEKVLRGEVATYDQDLTGDVYGYVIEDEDGNHVDSCWGFYGMDDVREQAKAAAESAIATEVEEVEKIARCMAL